MAVDVLTDTVIRRPIGEVAAYAAHPDHLRFSRPSCKNAAETA